MRHGALVSLTVLAAGGAGCGGEERQDAAEPGRTYDVEVVEVSFPARQHLARPATLRIRVRNAGDEAIPDLAVTVDSFATQAEDPGLASGGRPVWIVDGPPAGGAGAYTNTSAFGRLGPAQARTIEWRVTPVRAGTHTIRWRVAAGLAGRAQARAPGGGRPEGAFTVRVAQRAGRVSVDGATGAVVREPGR